MIPSSPIDSSVYGGMRVGAPALERSINRYGVKPSEAKPADAMARPSRGLQERPSGAESPERRVKTPTPHAELSDETRRRYEDIKQTARQAGYVGLSDGDITRAVSSGQSLLADYYA